MHHPRVQVKEAGCPSGGLSTDPNPLIEPAPVVVPKAHVVVAVLDDLGECRGVGEMTRYMDECRGVWVR